MPQRNKKQKSRTVYSGTPFLKQPKAQTDKAAELTPEEIAKLKADFIASLNEWANAKPKPSA
jgi:hypothetical protein